MRSILATIGLITMLSTTSATAEGGTITVSGTGNVSVVPDMANISLGVFNTAPSAQEAVSGMSDSIGAVIDGLLEAGIEETDIQTNSLRVNPIQDYNADSDRSRITGYSAQSMVTVRVTEIDELGVILDQVLSNGANQLNGLQFDVADREPHLNAARERAVADAMAKAQVYTNAAGVSLGGIVSMSESGGRVAPLAMEMSNARASGVPVAAGDISISANVTMTYAIED